MDLVKNKERVFETNNLVKIAIFSALAGLIMMFKFPIPVAPSFMTIDFGDVATLVSGFILGPISGIVTVVMKNIINLLLNGTTTFYVGEVSNIIVGSAFVGISSVIYHRHKTKKVAIFGLAVGVLVMTIIASLSNYFVIFPLYASVMGIDLQAFVDFMPPNNYVNTFNDMILFAIVPFNIIKGTLNSIVTVLIYKHISVLMKHK